MWFYGVDLMARWGRVDLKGQWMQGHADGQPSQGVYGLDLNNGAYLELDAMLTPSLGVLGRGEFRDAFVWLDTQRAYLTKVWRATLGLRWVIISAFEAITSITRYWTASRAVWACGTFIDTREPL